MTCDTGLRTHQDARAYIKNLIRSSSSCDATFYENYENGYPEWEVATS